jgi:hypothetical protein
MSTTLLYHQSGQKMQGARASKTRENFNFQTLHIPSFPQFVGWTDKISTEIFSKVKADVAIWA